MSERTMITGTSGRIGRAVAKLFEENESRIVGVDKRAGSFTTIVGDLASIDLGPVLRKCHTVIHCAALHAPHLADHSRAEFVSANLTATDRLLATAVDAGVTRFVFISTTSVYGRSLENAQAAVWVDEELQPEPRDIYDETKFAAEALVDNAHGAGFTTVTLRLARCFPETPSETVVNRLYRGLDIRDAVQGISAATDADLTQHHVLNIAGPRVFEKFDAHDLRHDASKVIARRLPWLSAEFADRGWELPKSIDRIYVSDAAGLLINYRPAHGLRSALASPQ